MSTAQVLGIIGISLLPLVWHLFTLLERIARSLEDLRTAAKEGLIALESLDNQDDN